MYIGKLKWSNGSRCAAKLAYHVHKACGELNNYDELYRLVDAAFIAAFTEP